MVSLFLRIWPAISYSGFQVLEYFVNMYCVYIHVYTQNGKIQFVFIYFLYYKYFPSFTKVLLVYSIPQLKTDLNV